MWKNLLLSLSVIVVLLFTFEIVARIVSNPLYVYNETLGYTLKPGATSVHKGAMFEATYHINHLGYRGKEYEKKRRPGTFRILLIGDSSGFGWGVQDNETFAALLEEQLANVEVVNLSVSGYGTDQELLRLKKEGLSYHPDLVIIQISDNDFTEIKMPIMYGRPKPFFTLRGGNLILQNMPVANRCDVEKEYYAGCLPLPFRNWLESNSRSYQIINSRYIRLSGLMEKMLKKQDSKPESRRKPLINSDDILKEYERDSIELFKAIIIETKKELSAEGIPLVMIHWDEYLSKSGLIDNMDIPVIDLNSLLHENNDILIPKDWHFNRKGHALVAEKIINVLTKDNLLPLVDRQSSEARARRTLSLNSYA